MSVFIYDPKKVVILVNDIPIGGYADGTFITVAYDENHYEKHVTSDGDVTRIRNHNRTGSLSITLAGSSNSNSVLSALRRKDEDGNDGLLKLSLQDTSGQVILPPQAVADPALVLAAKGMAGTTIGSAEAWIEASPSVDFSKDLSDREWAFGLATIDFFIAGSLAQSPPA